MSDDARIGRVLVASLHQAIADVVGIPVQVAEEPESAALGCAILVAASVEGAPLPRLGARMVRHRRVTPHGERHERYQGAYRKWRELNDQLEDLSL